MNRNIIRQGSNVLAALLTIVFNGLANALPLNGQTTGEISDRFQVYFTPAGYVFAIWGLIYIGIIVFAVYQARPSQRENRRLQALSYWFVLASAANIAWLFLWHYEQFPLTLVAMLVLLAALIMSYQRLRIGQVNVSTAEKWSVHVPFSIYLGWITVATIANVTILLDYLNWNGFGLSAEYWLAIVLIAALLITSIISFFRNDTAFTLVIVWAFIGIAVKNAGQPFVPTMAWIAVAMACVLTAVAFFKETNEQMLLPTE
jgi:hypothetical protein